jgi:GMC oxidoreductase
MFAYWTCNCPIPHPSELSGCLPPECWQRLLERARALLGVNTDLGKGSVRQDRIIDRVKAVVGPLGAGRDVQPMPVAVDLSGSVPRFRSADDLLARPPSPDQLILLTDLIARKVVHRGSRALGAVAYPRDGGDSVTIRAETVIVACGTAQSPQLLAASGIDGGPALGRYMFDHPAIGSRVVLQREIVGGIGAGDPLFTVWIPFAPERPWHNQVVRFPSNPSPIEFDAGLRETRSREIKAHRRRKRDRQ